MKHLLTAAVASLALAFVPVSISAAPCKDAKGKFVACPKPAATTAAKPAPAAKPAKTAKAAKAKAGSKGKCRDAKGRFAKCGTPGAKPA